MGTVGKVLEKSTFGTTTGSEALFIAEQFGSVAGS
jgi:hypothetical protein